MITLDLDGAARFLHCHQDTVRELAASGEIPAAKVGRAWVFVDVDLVEWLRTQYASCRYTKEVKSGGSISLTTEKELDSLLKPQTRKERRNSMTSSRLSYGIEKNTAQR